MNTSRYYSMYYEDILDDFIGTYVREFGERKYRNVLEKILTSKKITNYINSVKISNLPPNPKELFYCLNEIPFFIFSRGQTQAIGALIILQNWNNEINKQQHILNEIELKFSAITIIEELKDIYH